MKKNEVIASSVSGAGSTQLVPVNQPTGLMEALKPMGLGNIKIETPESLWLPHIAIEQKGDGDENFKLYLEEQLSKHVFNAPYVLVPLYIKQMYRFFDPKTQKYNKRIYMGGSTDKEYREIEAKIAADKGVMPPNCKDGLSSMVGVIYEKDNVLKCTIASLESAGGSKLYWMEAFKVCDLASNIAVQITDISHEKNLKTGKSGNYLSVWKFKGFQPITLTAEMLVVFAAALRNQKKQVESFMRQ